MSYFFKIAQKQIAFLIAYNIDFLLPTTKRSVFTSESSCCKQKGPRFEGHEIQANRMIYKQTYRHISYILGSSGILKGLALVRRNPGWSRAQGYLNNSLQQQIDQAIHPFHSRQQQQNTAIPCMENEFLFKDMQSQSDKRTNFCADDFDMKERHS